MVMPTTLVNPQNEALRSPSQILDLGNVYHPHPPSSVEGMLVVLYVVVLYLVRGLYHLSRHDIRAQRPFLLPEPSLSWIYFLISVVGMSEHGQISENERVPVHYSSCSKNHSKALFTAIQMLFGRIKLTQGNPFKMSQRI